MKAKRKVVKKKAEGRPALIYAGNESNWISCKVITRNLIHAYHMIFGEKGIDHFNLPEAQEDVWATANKIFAAAPSRLIFVDHAPHPHALIVALSVLYGRKALPPIYFHVYGDFTLYPKEFLAIEEILLKTRVKFICASKRQVRLVSGFLNNPTLNTVEQCHFPTDTKIFRADSKLRAEWRKKLGLSEKDIAVIYTGRISLQKNVVRLLQELNAFYDTTQLPIKVFMAGLFDELGAPLFGLDLEKGFFYQYYKEQFERLSKDFRSRVRYLGNFNAEQLAGLGNAGDFYASLSLHHDEDYGMSPAEALCCGTPLVLTSWGGYASFYRGNDEDVLLAEVRIGPMGLEISSSQIQKGLMKAAFYKRDDEIRKARSDRAHDGFSIEAAAALLGKIYDNPIPIFEGFNALMRDYYLVFTSGQPYAKAMKRGGLYERIYRNYVTP